MIKVNIHYNAHLAAFTYVMLFWPKIYTISPRTADLDTLLRYHAERIPTLVATLPNLSRNM